MEAWIIQKHLFAKWGEKIAIKTNDEDGVRELLRLEADGESDETGDDENDLKLNYIKQLNLK